MIREADIDLLVSEFLPEVGHHVTQLCCADEAVTIFVENPEGLPDFFFTVCVLHLSGHHCQELGEVNCAVAISIDLVDHVLKFGLCWVLSQGPHYCAQVFGGDCAISILVEQGECFFELSNLFLSQLISHFWKGPRTMTPPPRARIRRVRLAVPVPVPRPP